MSPAILHVLLASLLAPPPPVLPAIGAASLASRHPCAVIDGPALSPGQDLTIIVARLPQEALAGTIVAVVQSCTSGEGGERVAGPDAGDAQAAAYEIKLSSPGPDAPGLGVVFVGRFSSKRLTDAYELRVSDVYQRVRVRSCTSLEGVHLSVWSGTPRASRRLWHTYWHLGYDVEPTCEGDEVDDAAP